MLTPAQLAALKADILADPALAVQPNDSDGAFAIAAAYNLVAAPQFVVWRTVCDAEQVMGNGFIWTAVDALTVGKARIWDWMTRYGTFNPSKPNVRQGLIDAFGAGSAMATAIAPHLKRDATRAEKLFATGTGSTASPATMSFEGAVTYQEVFHSSQSAMKIIALCHTCAHQHPIDFDPAAGPGAAFGDWMQKHPGHSVDFVWPQRSRKARTDGLGQWEDFLPNADIKLAYAASAAYTCGIEATPLASSATLVAGRESTAVSNASNKYLDYLIGGKVTLGTTPTAGRIELWVYAGVNDTPTYPNVLDGTDSDETLTNADIKNAMLALGGFVVTTTTSDLAYWFKTFSLAALHGGFCPQHHGLFVTHNTVAAANATGSNHVLNHTGVYATAI